MIWQEYFPHIFVPNLIERTDRFERMKDMLWDYGIAANFWDATKNADGKLGLITTMKEIFKWCLEHNLERVIILEDDCDIVVSPQEFHSTMGKCCEDLDKINWNMFYLGLQHPERFNHWQTPNLLRVSLGYSTHAVGYSTKAMEFILQAHIDEPVDNFICREYQKYNTSFCSYPLLCSQTEGHSDIYNNYIDWRPVILPRFNENVRDILHKRFKTN